MQRGVCCKKCVHTIADHLQCLYVLEAGVVEGWDGVWGDGLLDFVTIYNGRSSIRQEMRFGGGDMAVFGKEILDVAFHGYPTGTVVVVPGEVYARILGTFSVLGDGVVIF